MWKGGYYSFPDDERILPIDRWCFFRLKYGIYTGSFKTQQLQRSFLIWFLQQKKIYSLDIIKIIWGYIRVDTLIGAFELSLMQMRNSLKTIVLLSNQNGFIISKLAYEDTPIFLTKEERGLPYEKEERKKKKNDKNPPIFNVTHRRDDSIKNKTSPRSYVSDRRL